VLRRITLTSVLAAWGAHEGRGRLKAELAVKLSPQQQKDHPLTVAIEALSATDPAEQREGGLEIALLWRAPLVQRLLEHQPTGECFEIEIEKDALPKLVTFNGQPVATWIDQVPPEAREFILSRTRNDVEAGGPLPSVSGSLAGPYVLIDGNHRGAAWARHQAHGDEYPLRLALIIVQGRPPPQT
jgi:hypothetical protein